MNKKYLSIKFALVVLLGFSFAGRASAATLSIDTLDHSQNQGQNFAVQIKLKPDLGENLNAVNADVVFDPNSGVSFAGVDENNSIIGQWVDTPALSTDGKSVHFAGIIPGGFSGFVDPFSPSEKTAGKILQIFFKVSKMGDYNLSLANVKIYLNDGKGTPAQVSSAPLVVHVNSIGGTVLNFAADQEPPLSFAPTLVHDPLIFDGQYAIVFSTKDTGSGIDHYEVKEGSSPWVVVTSPYLLKNQKLSSVVSVKAIDRNGNSIIENVSIPISSMGAVGILQIILPIILMVLFIGILIYKKYEHR